MPTPQALAVTAAEADALFADLHDAKALVMAVSGGPDSTALMVLAARWAKTLKRAPVLTAVTVDHGLRKESKREAIDVARLAKKLGIAHRTLRWTGTKPKTGLPQAARHARYRLLAAAARKAGSTHVLTAHTLDDQAETVIIRLLRGSGLTGLAAMQRVAVIPGRREAVSPESILTDRGYGFRVRGQKAAPRNDDILLVRPLLDIQKVRLVATLKAENIPFANDPTNHDPKFTRARLRGLMPQLAGEGLDAGRLALLARRLGRADQAIEMAVDRAAADLMQGLRQAPGTATFDAPGCAGLPAEVALRLMGRAIGAIGDEGPVELAKLEALKAALDAAKNSGTGFRRSLAGAIVTLARGKITVERAPPRRPTRGKALTKRRPGSANPRKTR